MTQPAEPPPAPPPPRSMPPTTMTGPMVAYALVRELPGIFGILAGAFVAALILLHNPASSFEPILSAVVPLIVNSLARSRPAESETIQRMTGLTGGAGVFFAMWLRHKLGGA